MFLKPRTFILRVGTVRYHRCFYKHKKNELNSTYGTVQQFGSVLRCTATRVKIKRLWTRHIKQNKNGRSLPHWRYKITIGQNPSSQNRGEQVQTQETPTLPPPPKKKKSSTATTTTRVENKLQRKLFWVYCTTTRVIFTENKHVLVRV